MAYTREREAADRKVMAQADAKHAREAAQAGNHQEAQRQAEAHRYDTRDWRRA